MLKKILRIFRGRTGNGFGLGKEGVRKANFQPDLQVDLCPAGACRLEAHVDTEVFLYEVAVSLTTKKLLNVYDSDLFVTTVQDCCVTVVFPAKTHMSLWLFPVKPRI